MSRTICVGGIHWPKTCGDYRLFKCDVQADSGPGHTPQFILRYKNNRAPFTLILYRGGTDAATGEPATVETQLAASSGTQTLLRLLDQPATVNAPIPLNVRSFKGHCVDKMSTDGTTNRELTFIRGFYGAFIKVRMSDIPLEEACATIEQLHDGIEANLADVPIPLCATNAERGPFGLPWGTLENDVQARGIQLVTAARKESVVGYFATELPNNENAVYTLLEFHGNRGLRRVETNYRVYDDPQGTRLRARLKDLEDPWTEFAGRLNHEPIDVDFYHGLRTQQTGVYTTLYWKNGGAPVQLGAGAVMDSLMSDQPVGWITVLYQARAEPNAADAGSVAQSRPEPVAAAPQSLDRKRRIFRATLALAALVVTTVLVIRVLISSGPNVTQMNDALSLARRGADCLHLTERVDGEVKIGELLQAGRDCSNQAGKPANR